MYTSARLEFDSCILISAHLWSCLVREGILSFFLMPFPHQTPPPKWSNPLSENGVAGWGIAQDTIRGMVSDYFLITGFFVKKSVKSRRFGGIWRRPARLDYLRAM